MHLYKYPFIEEKFTEMERQYKQTNTLYVILTLKKRRTRRKTSEKWKYDNRRVTANSNVFDVIFHDMYHMNLKIIINSYIQIHAAFIACSNTHKKPFDDKHILLLLHRWLNNKIQSIFATERQKQRKIVVSTMYLYTTYNVFMSCVKENKLYCLIWKMSNQWMESYYWNYKTNIWTAC